MSLEIGFANIVDMICGVVMTHKVGVVNLWASRVQVVVLVDIARSAFKDHEVLGVISLNGEV